MYSTGVGNQGTEDGPWDQSRPVYAAWVRNKLLLWNNLQPCKDVCNDYSIYDSCVLPLLPQPSKGPRELRALFFEQIHSGQHGRSSSLLHAKASQVGKVGFALSCREDVYQQTRQIRNHQQPKQRSAILHWRSFVDWWEKTPYKELLGWAQLWRAQKPTLFQLPRQRKLLNWHHQTSPRLQQQLIWMRPRLLGFRATTMRSS